MKNVSKLKWFVGVFSLAVTVVWLTGCGGGGGGGGSTNNGGGGNGTNAPASVAGRSITHTITGGTSPFSASGSFVMAVQGVDGDLSGSYTITGSGGVPNSSGNYSYTMTDANTATLNLQDSVLGPATESLVFQTPSSGTFSSAAGAGTQTGTFTLQ